MSDTDTDRFIEEFNEKIQALSKRIEDRFKLEEGFKTKVNDSLSGIKAKLNDLLDKKEELKNLVDKASDKNEEIRTQMAQKEAEIDRLTGELAEITKKNTLLEEQLTSVQQELTDASKNSVAKQKSMEDEIIQLQQKLQKNENDISTTEEAMKKLNIEAQSLKDYNDKLKGAMTQAVTTLSASLISLEENILDPAEIEIAYNDIVKIIDELSSIIEIKPPTQPLVQSFVFGDNTPINNYDIGYRTIGDLKNDLQQKAEQFKNQPNNKYAKALEKISSMKDLNELPTILMSILNNTTKKVKGGKKTRYTKKMKKTRKTRKVRKHQKQRGGFTYSSSSRRVSPETRRTTLPLKSHKRHKK